MKRILHFIVLIFFFCTGTFAQQNFFTATGLPQEKDDNGLGGLGGMLVYSPHDDIIITAEPIDCHIQVSKPNRTSECLYCYEVKADLSKRNDTKFTFSRQGKALQAELKQPLKKNHWYACRVEEVSNPIKYEDQTGRNNFSGKEGIALLEFSSTIPNFRVKPSEKLRCTIESHKQSTDASVTIITVSIDSKALKAAKDEVAKLEKEFDDLDKSLQAQGSNAKQEDWDRLDKLEDKKNKLSALYTEMCQVEISAPNSNIEYINIGDLGYKERKAYVIMALTESFESLYAAAKKFIQEYPAHTESSYYDAARTAYDKVLEHADCPIDQREAIHCERDTMASIRKYTYFAEETARRAHKAEAEQGFESDEVYKNLSGEYKFILRLITYHPEIQGLATMKTNVWNKLCKHPKAKTLVTEKVTIQRQVISGKVTMKNKYDTRPLTSLHVNVSKQQKVADKNARLDSKMVGNVAADGTFSVIMPDDFHYLFIDGEKKAHYITSDMTTIKIEL